MTEYQGCSKADTATILVVTISSLNTSLCVPGTIIGT